MTFGFGARRSGAASLASFDEMPSVSALVSAFGKSKYEAPPAQTSLFSQNSRPAPFEAVRASFVDSGNVPRQQAQIVTSKSAAAPAPAAAARTSAGKVKFQEPVQAASGTAAAQPPPFAKAFSYKVSGAARSSSADAGASDPSPANSRKPSDADEPAKPARLSRSDTDMLSRMYRQNTREWGAGLKASSTGRGGTAATGGKAGASDSESEDDDEASSDGSSDGAAVPEKMHGLSDESVHLIIRSLKQGLDKLSKDVAALTESQTAMQNTNTNLRRKQAEQEEVISAMASELQAVKSRLTAAEGTWPRGDLSA